MNIRVGSRGSQLALTQTHSVIEALKSQYPHLTFDLQVIKTKGDQIQNISLNKIGGKGVFVKEIEKALLAGEIDMAVHSMKDMPSVFSEELVLAPPPKRADPRDVLITKQKIQHLDEIPFGGVIGTGSKRRKYQLLQLRPDLKVVDIRGNVDTRLKKMVDQGMDGIILAGAGLQRLGLSGGKDYYIYPLSIEKMLPSPTQGILGIQIHKKNQALMTYLKSLTHEATEIQAKAERAFLKALNGSCHMPIGGYCHIEEERIKLTGLYGDERGQILVKKTLEGDRKNPSELGQLLGTTLLEEVKI